MIDKNKLPIWEQRMFELMDLLIFSKKVENQEAFLQSIGASLPADLTEQAANKPLFAHEQFYKASEIYGISMEWFYGFSEIMTRRSTKDNPLRMIKDAVALLEKQSR